MTVNNLGDLSHSYTSRQRNVTLRQDIERLTNELATGTVSDVRDVLAGNHSYLTDLERRADILDSYDVSTTEARIYTTSVQDVLGVVDDYSSELSSNLIVAGTSAIGNLSSETAAAARQSLESIVGVVNTKTAGRFLFSGIQTDQRPLPDTDTILTALRTAVAGAATPDDLLIAAKAWFDDPAGFDATVYQGGDVPLARFNLSESDTVTVDVRATEPRLREVIELAAVAAIAGDPAFGFDEETQSELFHKTGSALLGAQEDLIALRAGVGFSEATIEKVSARNAAELTSIEFAKAALLEVDPFEAATRLEEAQFQLQSLYSVTVRMSQLSLVNFL
ncbi:MAG: flagellin [Sulfitobacter sp.]